MESLNKHTSTLLFTAAMAVVGVWTGLFISLTQFQEIQQGFNTELPLWLSWVFPSFSYWFIVAVALFILFGLSFKSSLKISITFNKMAVKASVVGYVAAVAFVVFSLLAIYWPVMQSA